MKQMTKKALPLVFCAALIMGSIGCGSESDKDNDFNADFDTSKPASTSSESNSITKGVEPLPEDNWPEALEDEVLVELSDDLLTKNYYIIFDGSGSMKGSNMSTAKRAVKEFVSKIPTTANVGLLAFDTKGISERASLTATRQDVFNAVDAIIADGTTPLHSAIDQAYFSIEAQGRRQLGYGEYHLVIVTDGEASSRQEPDRIIKRILENTPIIVHTIGFRIGTNHSLNQPGRIIYTTASDFDELAKGLEDVLAESENFSVDSF